MAMATDEKLMKATKFPPEFNQKVDTQKIKIEVIQKWTGNRITEILGFEDEVLIDICKQELDKRYPNIKALQIQLQAFLAKDGPPFAKELWKHCLSAQASPTGVPPEMIEAKKQELIQEKAEAEKAAKLVHDRTEATIAKTRDLNDVRRRERGERGSERGSDRGRGRGAWRGRDGRPYESRRSPSPRRDRRRSPRRSPIRGSRDAYQSGRRNGRDRNRSESPDRSRSRSRSRSPPRKRHRSRSPKRRDRSLSESRSPSPRPRRRRNSTRSPPRRRSPSSDESDHRPRSSKRADIVRTNRRDHARLSRSPDSPRRRRSSPRRHEKRRRSLPRYESRRKNTSSPSLSPSPERKRKRRDSVGSTSAKSVSD